MDELEKLAKEKEFEQFKLAIGSEEDPTMLILRTHLFTENLLERLITFKLSRGDKVIESAALTYHQKLVLVDSFDTIPDSIISSLRNLNKLRNQCAHELDKKITDGDVTRIGSPLGKTFTKYKRDAKFDEAVLLRLVIYYVCGYLASSCNRIEHPELKEEPAKKEGRTTPRSTRTARKRAAG